MAAQPKPFFTPAQYLEIERNATEKSEYLGGEIWAMAGGSPQHNLISANVIAELRTHLKGKPCTAYTSDQRVQVSPSGLYTYPDAVVVCGEGRYGRGDTLLNPTLIVEVLSESTEAYDRGEKFAQYRRLESLREYVLVSQGQARVERFVRQGDEWMFSEARGLDASVLLESIGVRMALAEIYDKALPLLSA